MPSPTVLVLPGYGDSGPEHWQTLWERRFGYVRVVQDDWEHPQRDAWVANLDAAVGRAPGEVALVAHSLGCALVAHWAARAACDRVVGALLVAPPDVDEVRHLIPEVESFSPVPLASLPFPAIVVASASDPYIEPGQARAFADGWGARLVELGDRGHINAESGLGEWLEGHRLLEELLDAGRR
ncbi:MAG TPA: alpha/beta hydrolase [Candidatus Eisenbacteria bacterium]|nr:alpha/beta hydrolase [Candidatus Eisenbacteria bacterium]